MFSSAHQKMLHITPMEQVRTCFCARWELRSQLIFATCPHRQQLTTGGSRSAATSPKRTPFCPKPNFVANRTPRGYAWAVLRFTIAPNSQAYRRRVSLPSWLIFASGFAIFSAFYRLLFLISRNAQQVIRQHNALPSAYRYFWCTVQ
jgi:hypothetical protein